MNRKASVFLLLTIMVATILMMPSTASATEGTLAWPIRGFNYPSWWYDEYLAQASSDSLSRVAATGANWVAIDPTQFMDTVSSNSIAPENGGEGRTASDEAVARAIDDAHARGLKVMLKPHIDISDGTTRWDIRPANPALWFASYKNMIVHYASMAEAHQVELVSVGTELVTMSGSSYYGNWADVIGDVRSVYSGPITYAASTTECDDLAFAGLLDYLGLDVYFPLSDNAQPTLDELMAGWTDYHGQYGDADWLASIEQWQARWNKQVIFTELGYRSIEYVGMAPWDWSAGDYDGFNQARAYEAAFRVLGNKSWLAGVFWWDWLPGENTGSPGNTDYTVVDKPAEDVVKSWFALDQAQEPAILVNVTSVRWSSYADYIARRLSVDFRINNAGSGQATDIAISDSAATAGVQMLSDQPVYFSSLAPGGESITTVTYGVPAEVISFRAYINIAYIDSTGQSYHFPEAIPW